MAAYGTTASAGVAKILSGLLSEHNKCRGTFDQPTPGRRRPLSLSLVLSLGCVPPWLASFPPVQICISSARTPRLERSRKRYRSPRWPLCRATCLFAPKERGILPSLPSCVGVIPLDARGCCRNGQILRAKSLGTKNRKDL